MPTITSLGIGSGLDLAGIVDGLMAVERRPLEILQFRREEIGVKISAYAELLSSVSAFSASVDKLNSSSAFELYSTSSANEEVFTATASGNPTPGSYDVEVTRLAESHKLASAELLSTTSFGGAPGDELTIQLGADINDAITVDLSDGKTLEAIRDAINADEDNPGFTANVINGDGDNQKLVITADETGSDNEITFSYGGAINAGTFTFATVNDISGDINNLNAAVVVDGYAITRQSNTISDVIEDVTFNLVSADPGNSYALSVARDDGAVRGLVNDFVDAYNSLTSTIRGQRSGSLGADSVLLSLENQIRSIINSPMTSGTYTSLNDIGISLQREGNMAVDGDKLDAALAGDIGDIASLFATEGSGFAWRLASLADQWSGTDGILTSRTEGLSEQIDDLDDQQLNLERNLAIIETRYRTQFASLDTLVSQFQNTSTFLTSQLAQLSSLRLDNS